MRMLVFAATAALVAACTPPVEEAEQMSEGCEASAALQWGSGETLMAIEATTTGPDCERAVATLVLRDTSGVPVYADVHMTAHVMTLAPVREAREMETALADWIDPDSNTTMTTTAALPEWPANATSPQSGEFPFYVEPEWNDRRGYEELRARAAPLFCYVQGMESMSCVALDNGSVNKIGVQAFPG